MFESFEQKDKTMLLDLIAKGVGFEDLDTETKKLKISVPEFSPQYQVPEELAIIVANIFNELGYTVLYRIRKGEHWDETSKEWAISDTKDILNL